MQRVSILFFSYSATVPVKNSLGKFETKEFKDIEDVWNVIWLLEKEVVEQSQEGMDVNIAGAISTQLPFFSCKNNFLSNNYLDVIQKYHYCKEFNVPPHEGDYKKAGVRWLKQTAIIKSAYNVLEKRALDKSKQRR